jgi:hypothetical protein
VAINHHCAWPPERDHTRAQAGSRQSAGNGDPASWRRQPLADEKRTTVPRILRSGSGGQAAGPEHAPEHNGSVSKKHARLLLPSFTLWAPVSGLIRTQRRAVTVRMRPIAGGNAAGRLVPRQNRDPLENRANRRASVLSGAAVSLDLELRCRRCEVYHS